jgi:hypothetical protein
MIITRDHCSMCGADLRTGPYSRRVGIVDPDLDCVVAYQCPDCGAEEPRPLSEIILLADPTALKEIR